MIEEISMIFLTGAIASIPIAFFITTGRKYISTRFSNGFETKAEGIIYIGMIQLITGSIIKFGGDIIESLFYSVSKYKLSQIYFTYPQIYKIVPFQPEVRTAIGVGSLLLWVNLHLTVNDFNIGSLGDSPFKNGLFLLATVLFIFL